MTPTTKRELDQLIRRVDNGLNRIQRMGGYIDTRPRIDTDQDKGSKRESYAGNAFRTVFDIAP